ncbi:MULTISPECIES: hypothetical protein [unclassified Rhizobium]|uniref:hypothetical protein n=1 Tax=unclassified Rhizobium TaxID=2613769 RepID=UPI002167624E|nr:MULTISPECIES: hypothetical protein [unclassified Rhizobium]MCS3742592.1 hypothetical protein [Rhizobium sp. BK661]MCS4094558.1 hypothetical protein [Rhizobium sp. BK176]
MLGNPATIRWRLRHWQNLGLDRQGALLALADDSYVPDLLDAYEVAAMAGLSIHAIRKRRKRGKPPAGMRLGASVLYGKGAVVGWLVASIPIWNIGDESRSGGG